MLVASIIVMAIGSPYVLAGLAIVAPLGVLLIRFYLPIVIQLRKVRIAAQAPMIQAVRSTLDGRTVITALGSQAFMSRAVSEAIYQGLKPLYYMYMTQYWATIQLIGVNAGYTTILTALLVGLRGHANVGWAGLALVNAISSSNEVFLLMQNWTEYQAAIGSVERIQDFEEDSAQETVAGTEVHPDSSWPKEGRVELSQVCLSYGYVCSWLISWSMLIRNSDGDVVKNVDLAIEPGKKVAILGRTGR